MEPCWAPSEADHAWALQKDGSWLWLWEGKGCAADVPHACLQKLVLADLPGLGTYGSLHCSVHSYLWVFSSILEEFVSQEEHA